MVCALILINLYVGVIFSQFTRISAEEQGSAFMTPEQRQWVAAQETVFRLRPLNAAEYHEPEHWLRGPLYRLVTSRKFE